MTTDEDARTRAREVLQRELGSLDSMYLSDDQLARILHYVIQQLKGLLVAAVLCVAVLWSDAAAWQGLFVFCVAYAFSVLGIGARRLQQLAVLVFVVLIVGFADPFGIVSQLPLGKWVHGVVNSINHALGV